jgi:hypothetical protein
MNLKKIVFLTFSFLLISGCDSESESKISVCSNVSSILELQYRDAIILLENGKKIKVNQARIKLGDKYCYYQKQY